VEAKKGAGLNGICDAREARRGVELGSSAAKAIKNSSGVQDHQNKLRIVRAVAPPLGACYPDTITAIIETVALHSRRTIPALADVTLDDFEVALADLRPQLATLLREHVERDDGDH
jgi:hypothetical protein